MPSGPPILNGSIVDYIATDGLRVTRTVPGLPSGRSLTKAWLTIKATEYDPDPTGPNAPRQKIVTTAATAQGQVTDNGTGGGSLPVGTGSVLFIFVPADFNAVADGIHIQPGVVYQYDLKVLEDDGTPATIEKGVAMFMQPITQAVS